MIPLRRTASPLLMLALALVSSGCISRSIRSDLHRIEQAARVDSLDALARHEVDPISAEEASRILTDGALDIEDAVRVAILNNRELRAQLREIGIVRGEVLQAGTMPNPMAHVDFLPERDTRVSLRVEYDITGAIVAKRRGRAGRPLIEAERHHIAAKVLELGYEVRTQFYRVLAAEAKLKVGIRALDALLAGRDAALALYESGGMTALDMKMQLAAYERERVRVAELDLDLAHELEHLRRLLGASGEEAEFTLTGGLERAPEEPGLVEEIERRALEASLELEAMRERITGLARSAGVLRLEGAMPRVLADVHALIGDPRAPAGTDARDEVRVTGGFSLGIPMFDRNQGAVSAKLAELAATTERYYGLAIDLRSYARDTENTLRSTHRRALHYQEIVLPAEVAVREETLLHYNAMQVGIFNLIEAHRRELDAELQYLDTLAEYWSARARVDALLAGARITDGK